MSPVRLALKRLSASDLTLFESLFRTIGKGNQKAINLNRDILVDILYPALPAQAAVVGNEVPVSLTIYGPGGTQPHKVARKIIKNQAYKNWRLDGEFILNPEWNPTLYDALQPGDIAVMSFDGDPLPSALDIALVAKGNPADAPLYAALGPLVAAKSMVAINPEQLTTIISSSGIPPAHPINSLAVDQGFEEALEDAAQGGIRGIAKVRQRLGGRTLSAAALSKAKASAEITGQEGEGLINAYLSRVKNPGGTWQFAWVSKQNAIAPYDFRCRSVGGSLGDHEWKAEVKSTKGQFASDFHISFSELVEAAQSQAPYRIYRVHDLDDNGGKFRESNDVRDFAKVLIAAHDGAMPGTVKADSFSVPVDTPGLEWGKEIYVEQLDEDEGEGEIAA